MAKVPYRFDIMRKSTVQFLNVFNDITVNKYDNDGNVIKEIDVPLKLSGKQKFYYWLFHRRSTKRLPIMSATVTSVQPAIGETGRNKNLSFTDPSLQYKIATPTPYNLNFELNFATEYIDEANQILEQILPYFQPYVMTTINLQEIGIKFDMKIILNSLSEDKNVEMEEDEYRTLGWTLEFTAHTLIFKPIYDAKLVETIYLNYLNMGATEQIGSDTTPVSGDQLNVLERSEITDSDIKLHTYEELHGLE